MGPGAYLLAPWPPRAGRTHIEEVSDVSSDDLGTDPLRPFAKGMRFIGWCFVLLLLADLTTIEESWNFMIFLPLSCPIEWWGWWIERQCSRDLSGEPSTSVGARLLRLRFWEGTHGEENAA